MRADVLAKLRAWANELRAQLLTLWFCSTHPATPWHAKLLAALVAAYAFSPIDLIPDFIPVLGYLDDLIIVPLGIYVALRLVPRQIVSEARRSADEWIAARRARPRNYVAAFVFIVIWLALALGLWLMLAPAARAAPNEIKVFTDELAPYRGETLETHVNKARSGPLRVMPEYSYGIWRNWEFSLQLPLAFGSASRASEGYRTELQYIAPHDIERGPYWGINLELARDARLGEEHFTNLEVIPIVGWRSRRWHLVANPGFERPLSGGSRSSVPTPAAKIAYRAFGRNDFGLEYYRDAGPSHMLYLAWDGKLGRSDINVGVGRGFTSESDRWVIKAIYEFLF